jgi:hypothetical protein
MANRSTFNSVLPREYKRFVDLTNTLSTYEKRVAVDVINSKGEKVSRFVIRKDYDNEIRSLFLDAHKHHKKVHQDMLTQKNIVDTSTEETPVV